MIPGFQFFSLCYWFLTCNPISVDFARKICMFNVKYVYFVVKTLVFWLVIFIFPLVSLHFLFFFVPSYSEYCCQVAKNR